MISLRLRTVVFTVVFVAFSLLVLVPSWVSGKREKSKFDGNWTTRIGDEERIVWYTQCIVALVLSYSHFACSSCFTLPCSSLQELAKSSQQSKCRSIVCAMLSFTFHWYVWHRTHMRIEGEMERPQIDVTTRMREHRWSSRMARWSYLVFKHWSN